MAADLHQQLQLQLRQPPSLTAAVLTEYIVVILNEGMSVCGAGDINKDLHLRNKNGFKDSVCNLPNVAFLIMKKSFNLYFQFQKLDHVTLAYSVKSVPLNFPPLGAIKGGDA